MRRMNHESRFTTCESFPDSLLIDLLLGPECFFQVDSTAVCDSANIYEDIDKFLPNVKSI
jgi:hypothetical protein